MKVLFLIFLLLAANCPAATTLITPREADAQVAAEKAAAKANDEEDVVENVTIVTVDKRHRKHTHHAKVHHRHRKSHNWFYRCWHFFFH